MPHGGIMGTLGWGAMLLFDMAIADVYFERSKPMSYALSLFFLVLGIYLVQWLGPITMGTCSPTFILVGTGLSGAVFALFDVVDRFRPARFDFLAWWGKTRLSSSSSNSSSSGFTRWYFPPQLRRTHRFGSP